MSLRLLSFLIVSIALFGCKEKRNAAEGTQAATSAAVGQNEADSLLFFYKRTPCFGTCRTFELSIYSSGYAVFEGKQNVELIGKYHSTFSKAALQRIEKVVNEIEYFRFNDSYDFDGVQDLPSVHTTVNLGGKKKSVHDRYQGPPALDRLYEALDEEVKSNNWIQE